jgi:polyhydroxybutyrate depolymerase
MLTAKTAPPRLLLSVLILLAAPQCPAQESAGPPRNPRPGTYSVTIPCGGFDRTYLVHVPKGFSPEKRLPLVIMLHGGGGTGRGALEETGWDTKADREGFLAAFPDALARDPSKRSSFVGNPQLWNDGSFRFFPDGSGPDDVAFIAAVIDDLQSRYPVDRKRIYLTGFSNGASMCFLAAASLPTRIAAAAPASGAWWRPQTRLERPVPLCYITGDSDPLNPLAGGRLTTAAGRQMGLFDTPKPPVLDSVTAWAEAVGCPGEPASTIEKDGVITRTYGPGRGGAEVLFITVGGMGHNWAGGLSHLPESVVGKRSNKLNATNVIWEFFARHPLP